MRCRIPYGTTTSSNHSKVTYSSEGSDNFAYHFFEEIVDANNISTQYFLLSVLKIGANFLKM